MFISNIFIRGQETELDQQNADYKSYISIARYFFIFFAILCGLLLIWKLCYFGQTFIYVFDKDTQLNKLQFFPDFISNFIGVLILYFLSLIFFIYMSIFYSIQNNTIK